MAAQPIRSLLNGNTLRCQHSNQLRSLIWQKPSRTVSRSSLRCRAAKDSIQVTILSPAGDELHINKSFFSVGSAGGSDLLLHGKQVAEEHACIELKKGRLYCTALVGDPDNFMDDTFTWLNDSEIRPGCSYLLTPGAKLAFGEPGQQYTVQFDEKSGPDPLGDMLMKDEIAED